MKSLMLLWQVVANEYGDMCGVSTTHDVNTVMRRVEQEGFSFLTITLPRFCKDFERSLADGKVVRNLFQGFTWRAGLPQFLGGFLELVFDRQSGVLVDDPSIDSIHAVRQLTLLFGKVEVDCTPARVAATIGGFVDTEQELRESDVSREASQEARFGQMSALLWRDVLQRVDNDLYKEEGWSASQDAPVPFVIPRHGPGATADRRSGNRKYDFAEYTRRLEEVFPSREYLIPNERHYHSLDRVDILEPGAERPVRVVTVPKSLEKPRIIAIEPSYMQFMQQGVKNMLVPAIQRDPLMGSVVGFDDQPVNNRLAREGSLTGSLATLDLSEASDRVSNRLVQVMLNRWPHVSAAVDATRSRSADVPGHGVIPLAKFASMGSALTFPIEAMVFATVVFIGIEDACGTPLTRSDIRRLRGSVRVYGDDIIVPVDYAPSVVRALETFGFKVNGRKSFWTGLFRESCGKEYYAGHDVSVVRVRAVQQYCTKHPSGCDAKCSTPLSRVWYDFPLQRRFVYETESFVSLRNRFYLNGLWRTAKWLDGRISRLLDGHYPTIVVTASGPEEDPTPRSQVLSRWTVLPFVGSTREPVKTWTDHQTLKVRGWVVSTRLPKSRATDVGTLYKVLTPRVEEVGVFDAFFPSSVDPDHLERAGRPDAVRMKLRWTHFL
nr:MAG: hypothetical protein 3 [Leviviridae sp.]